MKPRLSVIYLLLWVIFSSCEEEQRNFEAPTVDILAVKKINTTTGLVSYQVKKGYGATIKELYADFYDITDTTSQVIRQTLQVKDSALFVDSALVSKLTNKHDYRVVVKLTTEKNEFRSTPQLLSLSQGYDESFDGVLGCDLNIYESEDIYVESNNGFNIKPMRKGEYFSLQIYCDGTFVKSNDYQIRLNGNIPVAQNQTYDIYTNYVSWGAKLPSDIAPGVYTVDLVVNGKRITAQTKIRVLPGDYSEVDLPDIPITYYSSDPKTSFLLNDKYYLIYNKKVVCYDEAANRWIVKNDLDKDLQDVSYVSIEDANFFYNNAQYAFIYAGSSKLRLMKYNEGQDKWEFVAEFPGAMVSSIYAFCAGDCAYMAYKNSNDRSFWEYNLKTAKWTQKHDLPDDMNGFVSGLCGHGDTGYCMTSFRELWQYIPNTDNWQKLSSLYSGPYSRFESKLVYDNGFVYVLGGNWITTYGYEALRDLYRYNLHTQSWEFIYLCQYSYNGTASKFLKSNKIIMLPCKGYDAVVKAEVVF